MDTYRPGPLAPLEAPVTDAVVVGAGPAGLSAALVLGRSRRSVLVVDDGSPRNAAAGHVQGYLGLDGTPPDELLARGRDEVRRYGVHLRTGRVTRLVPEAPPNRVRVELADHSEVLARRVLVATGLRDELPPVPGLVERWGRDVLHCPYCHGWEVRDRRLAVLGRTPDDAEKALTMTQWSGRVTLVLDGPRHGALPVERLAAVGVEVVEGPVAALDVSDDRVVGLRLTTGGRVPCDAVVVQPRMVARDEVLRDAGVELRAGAFGEVAVTDETGATGVPGLWAAGNVCDPQAQVVMAAAAGYRAALAMDHDLIAEDVDAAVAARR